MKNVYFYDECQGVSRKILGGKGAGLAEMTSLGLPVPPGFVITTDVCKEYYENGGRLPASLMETVRDKIKRIGQETGKRWGSSDNPLLVSVRSGAAISMPGMMDTVLNLGLNPETIRGLEKSSGSPRFSWDSYRRFIQLFGKVVSGIDDSVFDDILDKSKREVGAKLDSDLDHATLQDIVSKYKKAYEQHTKQPFPDDPDTQLEMAIKAVFASWMGERSVVYRTKNNITSDIADGTAVNVVAMVFGNMGENSATGVVFTRNPGDGSRGLFGDYLINAQGEDVVAGTRTPKPVSEMRHDLPKAYQSLTVACDILEKHFCEPQDIEFTLEDGRFYLLQTRNAKMNAASMVKTSVDMVSEGLIDRKGAIARLSANQLEQLLHDSIDPSAAKDWAVLTRGVAASPGAASGKVTFDVKRATALGESGESVILVREETKPEDVPAFFESVGILTSRGGKTSHAAVVARGMGKPCIVGCSDIQIDESDSSCIINGTILYDGDYITIDGASGNVYKGRVPTVQPQITDDFQVVMKWANDIMRLGIRANADTPEAAKLALQYGARGIGLCRTERMFNAKDRIGLFVEMIMARTVVDRKKSLKALQRLQRSDFIQILRVMEGYPVTIRLLDPPLHEFLPDPVALGNRISELDKKEAEKATKILSRARELAEVNPMMGHRGVRLGITYPEIYESQIRAVFDAAITLANEGVDAKPQIMIPQVGSVEELKQIKRIFDSVKSESDSKVSVQFGTMIEVVRAALTADQLAEVADFFSFGTNDLTQATYSFSREDVEGKFLHEYLSLNMLKYNPFQTLDEDGVGVLIEFAIAQSNKAQKSIEIGICGEHGGDPASVRFCNKAGLSYVSASPHRIPIAIIAAAQAALAN